MAKAQAGPVTYIFMVIFFVIIWALWGGRWIKEVGAQAIESAQLTGLEAFILSNLNLWIMLALVLGSLGYFYFQGAR